MGRMILVVSMVLVFAPAAVAQNLISNGDFASGISDWTLVGSGSLAFDANFDADADPGSGSARIANLTSLAFGAMTVRQCIEGINPGDDYDFGAAIYFDSQTNDVATRGHIVIYVMNTPGCGGSSSNVIDVSSAQKVKSQAISDTWVWTETLNYTVPIQAQSVHFLLYSTRQNAPTGNSVVLFDNLFFTPVPEPGAGGLAMMALCTLGWLRKRERTQPARGPAGAPQGLEMAPPTRTSSKNAA